MPLRELVAPPRQVPDAELIVGKAHQAGRLLSYRWSGGDSPSVQEVEPTEPISWPSPVNGTGQVTVRLSTSVEPVLADVRRFPSIQEGSGIPTGDFTPEPCPTSSGNRCQLNTRGEHVEIVLAQDGNSYLVVYAEWYVPPEDRADSEIITYSASWGFVVRGSS